MNMPGELVASLQLAGRQQIASHFDALVQEKLQTILGAPDSDLPRIKAEALEIQRLKNHFLQELQRAPKK